MCCLSICLYCAFLNNFENIHVIIFLLIQPNSHQLLNESGGQTLQQSPFVKFPL